MTGRIVLPPLIEPVEGPVIFLAGPIQGANWHNLAIPLLHQLAPEIHIASPRREYLDGEFVYEAQVDWETHFLRRAARQGVIMFWLAREIHHTCERAYAQTTRFELGEWKTRHEVSGCQLVIGIEAGFTNARYIRHRFAQDCPTVPICSSLEETCRCTIEKILPRSGA